MKTWHTGDLLIRIVEHGERPRPGWTLQRSTPDDDVHYRIAADSGATSDADLHVVPHADALAFTQQLPEPTPSRHAAHPATVDPGRRK